MANTIQIKRSSGNNAPSTLSRGELAYAEGSDSLFLGKGSGTAAVTAILTNAATQFGTANKIEFNGLSDQNKIYFPDNLQTAFEFREGSGTNAGNQYLYFDTTNSNERIVYKQPSHFLQSITLGETGTAGAVYDFKAWGGTTGAFVDFVQWDADAGKLVIVGNSSGADGTALDVTGSVGIAGNITHTGNVNQTGNYTISDYIKVADGKKVQWSNSGDFISGTTGKVTIGAQNSIQLSLSSTGGSVGIDTNSMPIHIAASTADLDLSSLDVDATGDIALDSSAGNLNLHATTGTGGLIVRDGLLIQGTKGTIGFGSNGLDIDTVNSLSLDAANSSNLTVTAAAATGVTIDVEASNSGAGDAQINIGTGTGANDARIVNITGANGTAAIAGDIDVEGDVKLSVNKTVSWNYDGAGGTAGTSSIVGNATSLTIDGEDTVNVNADEAINLNASSGGTVNITANEVDISGNLDVEGDVFMAEQKYIYWTNSNQYIKAGTAGGGDLTVSTPSDINISTNSTSGTVGITANTLNVSNNLDIEGDIILTNGETINWAGTSGQIKGTNGILEISQANKLYGTSATVGLNATTLLDLDGTSVDIDAGTNGMALDSQGGISLDAATDSNFSVSGSNGSSAIALDIQVDNASTGGRSINIGTTGTTGIDINIGNVASTVTMGNDLVVTGDLTINGDTTTVSTSQIQVEDTLLQLAKGNNTTDTLDIGFVGRYGSAGTAGTSTMWAGLIRDASDNKFHLFKDTQEDLNTASTVDTTTGGTSGFALADMVANGLYANDFDVHVAGNVTLFDTVGNNTLTIGTGTSGTVHVGAISTNTPMGVASGGMGVGSVGTNGLVYGNGTDPLGITAAGQWDGSTHGTSGTNGMGEILSVNSSGVPTWTNSIDGGYY